MKFINREDEFNFLEKKWVEKKAELMIIYGKRRVGKTELIKQFIKNKPSVYFLSDKRTTLEQLRELGRLMGGYFKDFVLEKQGFADWLDVFRYLKEKVTQPFIFAIDEYPYLVEVDKSISSIFQKGWDEYLKESNVYLILSGSSISMMESEVLIYKSPLYGRRTGQILLKPLSFQESREFFSGKNFDEFLGFYSVTGGLPSYLLQMDPKLSIKANIQQKIFPKTEFLHNEVEFILKEELREPKNYFSILKAIAWGKRKFGEIINETGLEKNVLTKYLQTLKQLYLIEKEVPVTEERPQKSRKGLYQIIDNYVRFWFQYIFPYKSDLEIGRLDQVLGKLEQNFSLLETTIYERVCQEVTWSLRDMLFRFERVGRWWDREKEIDVVALNLKTKEALFGEVKWSEKLVGVNVFEELKKKTDFVQWQNEKRREYYILFSKSGFTPDMIQMARKEKVYLVQRDRLLE